jgi:hypothetical protein
MAPPEPFTSIHLADDIFSQSNYDTLTSIIHEIGHIFDFNGSGGDPTKYKSQEFIKQFSSACTAGWLGCLGSNPNYAYIAFNFGTNGNVIGQYQPNPGTTTTYAQQQGSIDDFAESFTSYVMINNGGHYDTVSSSRYLIISTYVNQAKTK